MQIESIQTQFDSPTGISPDLKSKFLYMQNQLIDLASEQVALGLDKSSSENWLTSSQDFLWNSFLAMDQKKVVENLKLKLSTHGEIRFHKIEFVSACPELKKLNQFYRKFKISHALENHAPRIEDLIARVQLDNTEIDIKVTTTKIGGSRKINILRHCIIELELMKRVYGIPLPTDEVSEELYSLFYNGKAKIELLHKTLILIL